MKSVWHLSGKVNGAVNCDGFTFFRVGIFFTGKMHC